MLSEPLRWAHSSDLEDPTPWLTEGGLLLTDGTQFDVAGEAAWADGYVGRLAECGVAALAIRHPGRARGGAAATGPGV